jgi:hypothetical protein
MDEYFTMDHLLCENFSLELGVVKSFFGGAN